jgi:hypothetical protein
MRAHLDHDVEADALGGAAFGLEGADLDLDDDGRAARCGPAVRPSPWPPPARSGWAKASLMSELMGLPPDVSIR